MIRKSISCALAGLLTVVPALAFLFMLLGHWKPGSKEVVGEVRMKVTETAMEAE
jgi:hypothetical protein